MPCLVCGAKDTVKAHIFPRALMHEIRADGKYALSGTKLKDGATFLQSGLWDNAILCEAHERMLAAADDYGVDFCRRFQADKIPAIGADGFLFRQTNPALLSQFVMSVIWRFAVSRHGRDAGISLGSFAGPLADWIFRGTPNRPEIFVVRHEFQIDGRTIAMASYPHRFKLSDLNWWRFHISGFGFQMKLDRRPSGLPAGLLVEGNHDLAVAQTGPTDAREFREIHERMAAGPSPPPWLVPLER